MKEPLNLPLGSEIHDPATGIHGSYVAFTVWHDRSAEVAILRKGVNHDGIPWDVHWFPMSRMEIYND